MEGSCEIKGINIVSKPKIVFHKYANSVRKIHISFDGQTGPIIKKLEMWELKMFQESPQQERFSIVPLPSLSFCSALPPLLWP